MIEETVLETPKVNQSSTVKQVDSLSPSTRQRKSRLTKDITARVISMDISEEEQVEVLRLSIKQLGLEKSFSTAKPPRKATRRTPFESKLKVWEFWHFREFITESTLSSNPAHLRVGNRPAIQSGLQFKVPVTEQMLRNRPFHEAQWL